MNPQSPQRSSTEGREASRRWTPTERRVVVAAVGVTTLSALPVFMIGALQSFIRSDTGIGAAQIGLVIGTSFAVAAATSWPAGILVARVQERIAMVAAASITAVALLTIAVVPTSMTSLIIAAILAGLGSAAAQPPANATIAQHIDLSRRGLVFGVKQSSIPAGTMLAGLAVPVFAEGAGWRWAFVAACALAPTALLAPMREFGRPAVTRGWFGGIAQIARRQMVLLAVAGALGSASANAMGAFLVDWTVVSGGTAVEGARLATIGSLCGIVARILVGALGDHLRRRVFTIVLVQLAAGSVGFLLIASGWFGVVTTAGVILAFAGGWGWTGLLAYIVTSLSPENPAAATGISQFGVLAGGAVGPVVLGFAFASDQPTLGWFLCVGGGVGAMMLVLAAQRIGRVRATLAD